MGYNINIDVTDSGRQGRIKLLQEPRELIAKKLVGAAQAAALREGGETKVVGINAEAGGNKITSDHDDYQVGGLWKVPLASVSGVENWLAPSTPSRIFL